jgi:hypothetical protein
LRFLEAFAAVVQVDLLLLELAAMLASFMLVLQVYRIQELWGSWKLLPRFQRKA